MQGAHNEVRIYSGPWRIELPSDFSALPRAHWFRVRPNPSSQGKGPHVGSPRVSGISWQRSGQWGSDDGHSTPSIFFCMNSPQNLIPRYFSLPSYLSNRLETLHSFSLPQWRIFDLKEPTAFSRLDCFNERLSSTYHIPNIVLSTLTKLILATNISDSFIMPTLQMRKLRQRKLK